MLSSIANIREQILIYVSIYSALFILIEVSSSCTIFMIAFMPKSHQFSPTSHSRPNYQLSHAERRANHNATERLRRESLNYKFQELAGLLPTGAEGRKHSKAQIVSKSVDHVRYLNQKLLQQQKLNRHLYDANVRLCSELNQFRQHFGLPPVVSRDWEVVQQVGEGRSTLCQNQSERLPSGASATAPTFAAMQSQFVVNPPTPRMTPPLPMSHIPRRRASDETVVSSSDSTTTTGVAKRTVHQPRLSVPHVSYSTVPVPPLPATSNQEHPSKFISIPIMKDVRHDVTLARSCPSDSSLSQQQQQRQRLEEDDGEEGQTMTNLNNSNHYRSSSLQLTDSYDEDVFSITQPFQVEEESSVVELDGKPSAGLTFDDEGAMDRTGSTHFYLGSNCIDDPVDQSWFEDDDALLNGRW